MESSPFPRLLSDIRKVVPLVEKRRREHSVALWAVGDFFSDLAGGLVPFRDHEVLSRGARLAVLPVDPLPATAASREVLGDGVRRPQRWILAVVGSDDQPPIAAHDAPADVAAAAVREMPAFLGRYLKALQEGAGSKASVETAKGLVDAVAALSSADSKPVPVGS